MALSLDKEQKQVKLTLDKVIDTEVPPVQVKLLADVSGSMQSHYDKSRGYMYPILQRSIALASVIDPDKVVQMVTFDTKAYDLGDFGVDDFESIYEAFENNNFWGGTNYSVAFNKILETRAPSVASKTKGFFGSLFGKKDTKTANSTSNEPELIVFFTDGEDGGSHSEFITAVNKVLDNNTYLMCIGGGGSERYYQNLKQLAEERDNVGYVYFSNPHKLSDEAFYDTILSGEFGQWLKKFA